MRSTLSIASVLAGAGLVFIGGSAMAAGPPQENGTIHLSNEVSTAVDFHPCTGQAAQVTTAESGVIHLLVQPDGHVHYTGTLHAQWSADALPTDGVADAAGTYVVWFGGNGLLLENDTAVGRAEVGYTVNGKGTNADGSRFSWHQNAHGVFDPTGTPRLSVFNENTRCD